MVIYKRKKNKRLRGSKTHGWGAMKKHRGTGNKGGAGMAGSGKRGDAKKPNIWKQKYYFGKHGFVSRKGCKPCAVNIIEIEQRLPYFIKKGLAKKEGDSYAISLKEIGYEKLLSKGMPKNKYIVTADYASQKAIEKIEKAGGSVTVTKSDMASEQAVNAAADEA